MAADDTTPDAPGPNDDADFQPRPDWVLPPEKHKRGRAILIGFLVLMGVVVALAVALFFMSQRATAPNPDASPTAPVSATAAATSSPSPTATPTGTAVPSPSLPGSAAPEDPEAPDAAPTTAPGSAPTVVPGNAVRAFDTQVSPRLTDARTGLNMIDSGDATLATEVLEQLVGDVQRMSDIPPPEAIASDWSTALSDYAAQLRALQKAVDADSGVARAVSDAQAGVDRLVALADS